MIRLNVQRWAIRWALGCVNPASWVPLATGHGFTQPRVHLLAQEKVDMNDGLFCTCLVKVLKNTAPSRSILLIPKYWALDSLWLDMFLIHYSTWKSRAKSKIVLSNMLARHVMGHWNYVRAALLHVLASYYGRDAFLHAGCLLWLLRPSFLAVWNSDNNF